MHILRVFKQVSGLLLALSIVLGASGHVHALSYAQNNASAVSAFGSELTVVRFQQGEFRNRGNGQWDEISYKTNSVAYRFKSQAVTANHVTLFDASRNVTVVLDLNLGQILFAVGTPNFRPLYQITTFEFARRLPAGQSGTPTKPVPPPPPVTPQVYTPGGQVGGVVGGGIQRPLVDERRWQHFSAVVRGRRVHRLVYGIPETDAVSAIARCVRGSGAPKLIVGANVGNKQNGAGANISFNASGFNKSYVGEVVGARNTQERLAGIRLAIGSNDPLWNALARKRAISYSAFGKRNTLSLRGSSQPVGAFLRGCRPVTIAQNPGGGQVDGGEISCNRLGRISSKNSNRATNVTFVNRSGRTRVILWIDFNGAPKNYGILGPGQRKSFSTFLTHPWMLANQPGDCRQMFLPRRGRATFVVNR